MNALSFQLMLCPNEVLRHTAPSELLWWGCNVRYLGAVHRREEGEEKYPPAYSLSPVGPLLMLTPCISGLHLQTISNSSGSCTLCSTVGLHPSSNTANGPKEGANQPAEREKRERSRDSEKANKIYVECSN